MFKKAGKGARKPFCINESCANFTPEEKRGGWRKPAAAVEGTEKAAEEKAEMTKKYIVEGGDSLGYISRKFYGDNEGIERIMAANGLENADMIYEGQALWIPAE